MHIHYGYAVSAGEYVVTFQFSIRDAYYIAWRLFLFVKTVIFQFSIRDAQHPRPSPRPDPYFNLSILYSRCRVLEPGWSMRSAITFNSLFEMQRYTARLSCR